MLQSYLRHRKTLRTFLSRLAAVTFTPWVPRTARTWCTLSILVLGLSRTIFAQSQPAVPSFLQGQLVNASSVGVANASVQWSIPGTNPIKSITDARGNFAFEIPLSASTQVEVSAIANLYNPAQTSVTLQPRKTTIVKLHMIAKSSGQFGSVTGIVKNTLGVVIPNARVSILGAGGFLATTTDKTGKYQINNVGFNSNLMLQASTAVPPCIATTQVPLAVEATQVTANLQARGVHTIEPNCPPPQASRVGTAQVEVQPLAGIDDTVRWEQADSLSIASPDAANAWNAGRVNDILRFPPQAGLDEGLLVASDEGGVWWILTKPDNAMPLSNKWTSVTMSSLALGTGGPHDVYAGTYAYGDSEGGDLWESDTSQPEPLYSWATVNPKPPCGSINKVLVISELKFIVLACDTGLYWSQIPAPPSVHGAYHWQQAAPAAVGGDAFSGLAKGPGWSVTGSIGTVVASRWGAPATNQMIYTATVKAGNLVLTPSVVGGVSQMYNRTSVAACATNPQIMYAVGSVNGSLGGVFYSTDAGAIWKPVNLPTKPGTLGESDQAIAVSPDCNTVALGWETGTFVSSNQGASWTMLTDLGEYNNLHTDITALTFDIIPADNLFIGSAGGVAESIGVNKSVYDSEWNKELFNLEFLQGSPSDSATGLVAGAARDNGVLYSVLPGEWQHVMDCPLSPECWGNVTEFAPFDRLIAENVRTTGSTWGAEQVQAVKGVIPLNAAANIPVKLSCTPCTPYTMNVVAPVRDPGYFINGVCKIVGNVNDCEAMYAVSEMTVPGAGGDGLYGLFAYAGDETDIHWELLNSGVLLWSQVTAIAPTYDGQSIFVGNANGQIYRLDYPFNGAATRLTVNLNCAACGVNGLYAFKFDPNAPQLQQPGLAFAAYGPHFLAYNGTSWDEMGQTELPHNHDFLSILATDPAHLYLASSAGVFDSKTGGATWSNASVGLPTFIAGVPGFRRPSLASHDYLQIVSDPAPNFDTRLYLASFGRSVWRTYAPIPSPPLARAFSTVIITIQTGNDNIADYSELQATIQAGNGGFHSICLKPSTTSDPSYENTCPNGPGATDKDGHTTWNNGQIVSQTFTLDAPTVLDHGSIQIELFQHNSGTNSPDNWDLQAIEIDGQDTQGILPVLKMSNGPVSGNNCMARFKEPPSTALVIYALSGDDPEGINISHSISTFGVTPPGSCPQ